MNIPRRYASCRCVPIHFKEPYMDKRAVIEKTKKFVKNKLSGEGSGHDWWHVYRVWRSAAGIAEKEGADLFIVELASLLHDIADWKFNDGDEDAGARLSDQWLSSLGVDRKTIGHVSDIVKNVSFKGAKVVSGIQTLEGMVVQDADRLDAIGAMGIARAFAYGGYRNREMYDPDIQPKLHQSFEDYKNSKSSTINHFYEKLLLLKDLMNTPTARKLAVERHEFMEEYLERFFKEWEGKR